MDLPLDQLRTLAAVIDHGSFEAAARAMLVTPSAVSQRIKALETQAGRVLVQRTKPASVTESGGVILRLARQLELLSRDAETLLAGDGRGTPSIPIVVNADSLATWFLPAIADVHGVCFDLYREDQDHSTALLRDGTVMAAVTSEPEPVQGCTVTRLGAMRYQAMASPAFLERWMPEGPTLDALAVAPLVVFDRKDGLQDRYLRRRTRRRLAPPRHHVPASADFVEATALGLGWGMIPEVQSERRVRAGELVLIDRQNPIDVPLHWQQWTIDSPALAGIAAAVAAAAHEHLR